MWEAILDGLQRQRPAVLLTRLHDGSASHALIDLDERRVRASAGDDPYGPDTVAAACEFAVAEQESGLVQASGVDTFVHVLPRPDELLIVGAGHIAVHLVAFARELGFRTVVVDPRRVFAASERFAAEPDELLAEWPTARLPARPVTESTYAVLLTHDPKIDDAALGRLLPSPAAYIGALGSSRTHARRRSAPAGGGVRHAGHRPHQRPGRAGDRRRVAGRDRAGHHGAGDRSQAHHARRRLVRPA